MLIATFGPTTGWAGKKITQDGEAFVLEDHGPISACDVMEYDAQGHLVWASDGTRAWVGSLALKASPEPSPPKDPADVVRAVSRPFPQQAAGTSQKREDGRSEGQVAASIIGLLLLIIGLGVAGYFLLAFDVTVEVPYQDLGYGMTVGGDRVNNIGLMADRQNGIIIGLVLAVGGGILMVIGRKRTRLSPTPVAAAPAQTNALRAKGTCGTCGGEMDVGVAYCPHCGKKLTWTGVEAT